MAPAAKVAAYKACWTGRRGVSDGCYNSDSVAAINDAVRDGVDVINYSIGGGSESDVLDPVAQAFRGASNANVYVAQLGGQQRSGREHLRPPGSLGDHGGGLHFPAGVPGGNGARYLGASTTTGLATPKTLVTSVSAKVASATDADAALCKDGTLDAAKASGKIVQCDRGVIDRVAKGVEVKRAGGVGMVLTNISANSLNGDYHLVPAVHVDHVARAAILAYTTANPTSATAMIVPPTPGELAAAPQVPEIAAFSSRGPSVTTDGDILKPDLAAPGVDVVAAVAPPFHFGRVWDYLSGTSMASPHIAGMGALVKALHPRLDAFGDQVGPDD